MSDFNSKEGGIMFIHVHDGTFGTLPVAKYVVEQFDYIDNGRSAGDPARAYYKECEYRTWVLRLDGKDEHANIAMRAYIASLRGVNDLLATELLTEYSFLKVDCEDVSEDVIKRCSICMSLGTHLPECIKADQ